MSKAAISVFVFGIYMALNGFALLVIPNSILNFFEFPTTNDVWIRVVGMLMLILAYYYIFSARKEITSFFYLSIPARFSGIIFFTAFVLFGLASPKIISFGVIDLLSGIWTTIAFKKS